MSRRKSGAFTIDQVVFGLAIFGLSVKYAPVIALFAIIIVANKVFR